MESNNKLSRFEEREQSFLLVFEKIFNAEPLQDVIDSAQECRNLQFCDYAFEVANGVGNVKEDIDKLIENKLKKGWTINRISKTSLAIMRVAIYEMMYCENVPNAVAINEAVELAKKYTIDESKFVNGVLGAVEKDL